MNDRITFKELYVRERLQYKVLFFLVISVLGATAILYSSDHLIFQRFIGNALTPLAAFSVISILGFILLSFLLLKGWLAIYKKKNFKKIFRICVPALLFVPISIFVDIKVGFPEDINVKFPESVLFYPAIGFLVEIIFHVLPIALLLWILTLISRNTSTEQLIRTCILPVSLLEPVFQTLPMFTSVHYPLWSAILVFINISVFNFFQLLIFKRHDFISMYSSRLMYYLGWHMIWGSMRLNILF